MPVDRKITLSPRLKIIAFLLFMIVFGGGMYVAGHQNAFSLVAQRPTEPRPEKGNQPKEVLKPKVTTKGVKPSSPSRPEPVRYTFFRTLDDPSMQTLVSLDGRIVSKENVGGAESPRAAGTSKPVVKAKSNVKPVPKPEAKQPAAKRSEKTAVKKTPAPAPVSRKVEKAPAERKTESRPKPQSVQQALEALSKLPDKVEMPVSPDSAPSVPAQSEVYWLQVSSFREQARADVLVEDLKKKGYPAFSRKFDIAGKGIWYRVYLGQFSSRQGAEAAAARATASHSLKTMVVRVG